MIPSKRILLVDDEEEILRATELWLSFAGFDVDCTMNMSSPRTFSKTSTKISPSLNRSTRASTRPTFIPLCIDNRRETAFPRVGFAFPVMIFGSWWFGIGNLVLMLIATQFVTDS